MGPNFACSLRWVALCGLALLMISIATGCGSKKATPATPFLASFNTVTQVSSTVPANGDINPYGIAQVPQSMGSLVAGNFLISNFNAVSNLQGTGTTIVQVSPGGAMSLFAHIVPAAVSCPGGIGLTTALVALQSGFVVVGSLPTMDGTSATAGAGCLIVLDSTGNVVKTIAGSSDNINGPWDMIANDAGSAATLFVTNVLNGTVVAGGNVVNKGTVVRIALSFSGGSVTVVSNTVIASTFPEKTDPAAMVVGPTGVAFDSSSGTLYVADSIGNRIAAIDNAMSTPASGGNGRTVSMGSSLNDPLGLTLASDGHLIAVNGANGNMVEIDPVSGSQVAVKMVDHSGSPPGAGALFGLVAVSNGVFFVDDATNTLNFLH
jgi:hypothetical protein